MPTHLHLENVAFKLNQGRLFLFDFYNCYAAARSLLGICFEFCVQCISHCFCTDLGAPEVAESNLSPICHRDVVRVESLPLNRKDEVKVSSVCSLPWEMILLACSNTWIYKIKAIKHLGKFSVLISCYTFLLFNISNEFH